MSRRSALAQMRAERRRCPECGRAGALSTVLNPGTASTVCRWCGYERTTVLADLESDGPEGGE